MQAGLRLHTDAATVQPNSQKKDKKCRMKEGKRDRAAVTGEGEVATVGVEEVTVEAEAEVEATVGEVDSEEVEGTEGSRGIAGLYPSRRVKRSK